MCQISRTDKDDEHLSHFLQLFHIYQTVVPCNFYAADELSPHHHPKPEKRNGKKYEKSE